MKNHVYQIEVQWTGNLGTGTSSYQGYSRAHDILVEGKEVLHASSDVVFRGDGTKYNPEDLFLSSISSCHMLWYLHLCSQAGVVVADYIDNATGIMKETENGGGHFTEVTLNPLVTVTEKTMVDKANELHKKANELCFIANSVNFPVFHRPTTKTK